MFSWVKRLLPLSHRQSIKNLAQIAELRRQIIYDSRDFIFTKLFRLGTKGLNKKKPCGRKLNIHRRINEISFTFSVNKSLELVIPFQNFDNYP